MLLILLIFVNFVTSFIFTFCPIEDTHVQVRQSDQKKSVKKFNKVEYRIAIIKINVWNKENFESRNSRMKSQDKCNSDVFYIFQISMGWINIMTNVRKTFFWIILQCNVETDLKNKYFNYSICGKWNWFLMFLL
jgi:hypothetical protein